jgi:glycosyltransferase involved in cell wall biosynthesis
MDKIKSILINGYFHCRNLTGIERYAYEITKRLDLLCKPGEISIIIPKDTKKNIIYKNINIIYYGKKIKNIFWQMFTLQWFLITHRQYTILEFGNTALPFSPGLVFLHDIYCEFFPKDFSGFRNKVARIYNRFQYRLIAKHSKHIVTVSNFSKNQIIDYCKAKQENISVIYSSWFHYKDIKPDYSIFSEFSSLSNPFYFSLGSLSKRKNIKWIIDYARKKPDSIFAISGISLFSVKSEKMYNSMPQNIIMLGYLNDAKVKALMERCKAFLLPSYYEGFGLTPLEALSCNAQIIISNAASLPEIYGNTAHYIDPFNTDVDLDALLRQPVEKPDAILEKYSYETSANMVYNLLKEYT